MVDPLDGTANAAAGTAVVFFRVLVEDETPVEALPCWLETGRTIQAVAGTGWLSNQWCDSARRQCVIHVAAEGRALGKHHGVMVSVS